jgi:hypothetical protein
VPTGTLKLTTDILDPNTDHVRYRVVSRWLATTVAGGTDLLCFTFPTLPQATR